MVSWEGLTGGWPGQYVLVGEVHGVKQGQNSTNVPRSKYGRLITANTGWCDKKPSLPSETRPRLAARECNTRRTVRKGKGVNWKLGYVGELTVMAIGSLWAGFCGGVSKNGVLDHSCELLRLFKMRCLPGAKLRRGRCVVCLRESDGCGLSNF